MQLFAAFRSGNDKTDPKGSYGAPKRRKSSSRRNIKENGKGGRPPKRQDDVSSPKKTKKVGGKGTDGKRKLTASAAAAGRTLIDAAARGNLARVQEVLEGGAAPVNFVHPNRSRTALHAAAVGNHAAVVDYLLQAAHASPYARDQFGNTPLALACDRGNVDIVKSLLKSARHGILESTDNMGNTALHRAAAGGKQNMELVQFLVGRGSNLVAVNQQAKLPEQKAGNRQIKRYLHECMERAQEAGRFNLQERAPSFKNGFPTEAGGNVLTWPTRVQHLSTTVVSRAAR